MNFLAHLYLSGDDPEIKIGNFIGDFVKGRNLHNRYPERVAKGIELHRLIDEFTDVHDVVQRSKNRLRPKYRHYSGVIVDVFYDHFLASLWPLYHGEPLESFAANSYKLIRETKITLPKQVGYMLRYMEKGNWLVNYSKVDGIDRALTGMAHRTPFESRMEEASEDLEKNYKAYQEEFKTFFPQLKSFCQDWINKH